MQCYGATKSVAGENVFGGGHEFNVWDVTGWYEGGAVHVWVVGQTLCGSFEFWSSPHPLSRFFVLIANAVHYKK